jgi:hypothetical protein
VKVSEPEGVPPEVTVTLAVPAVAIRLADTVAVSCVALTKVVVSTPPFHWTCEAWTKPVPVTVSVKSAVVAVVDAGLRAVAVGVGLLIGRVSEFDKTPPEVTTMVAEPAVAIRLAVTEAVSCVALTTLVVSAVPFHWIAAPARNPVPVTVSVKVAPPAVAEAGLRVVMAAGALIVKVSEPEGVPPEVTVTLAVPAVAIRLAVTVAVS